MPHAPFASMKWFRHAAGVKALHQIRRIASLAVVAWQVQPLCGQFLDHFNPLSASANGVHLYGASVSSMYAAGAGAGLGLGVPLALAGSADTRITTIQASTSLGWSRTIEKSFISASYSPSYVRGLSGTTFDSTNHAATFSWGKPVGPKWSMGSTVNGILSDFNQLLSGQTQYGSIVTTPATFEELASAVLRGTSDNLALNRSVGAPPMVSSPDKAFLYGGRILNLSAGLSTSYAYSSRSSLTMSLNAARWQSVPNGNNLENVTHNSFLSKTTSGSAMVGWSYSLSPRTTLSSALSTSRTFSTYQDAYANQGTVSIGRTITSRWFAQGMAGVGWITPIRQTFQPKTAPQMTYGVSTGYKIYSHTFVASFTRSVSDVYGIGASASEGSSAAWSWKRPGSTVSLTANFSYARLIGEAFSNTRSWSGSASVGKALSSHLAMSVAYGYTQFPRSILTTGPNLTQSVVTASLSWSPSERR